MKLTITLRFVSDGIESSSAPDADMMIDWFFQFVMNSPPSAAAFFVTEQAMATFSLLSYRLMAVTAFGYILNIVIGQIVAVTVRF